MTTISQPVTGQDIAVAARATRQVLDEFLAEHGISFAPFATLNTIVAQGETLDTEALLQRLAFAMDVDPSTVRIVLHGLEARGLVRHTASSGAESHFELTPDGQAEHHRLNGLLVPITADLYRDIDPQDLATVRQVLLQITERATKQVASRLR